MKLAALLVLGLVLPGSLWAQNQDQPEKKVRRQANLIVRAEIDKVANEATNAFDVIQRLRPHFLRTRGATSLGGSGHTSSYAKVVVDGVPRGELDVLRQIPVMSIEEIQYLGGSDASIRFGTGYDGGAIVVRTRSH